MTTIGYATLQIIPSLEGVSEAVNKQLGGKLLASGKQGGKQLAKGIGDGLKDLEREVESAAKAYDKLRDRAADAAGKIRVEEEKLARARQSGRSDSIAAAEERLSKARRDGARYSRDAEQAHGALTTAQKRLGDGADNTGRRMGGLGTSMRNMGAVAGGAALAGVTALAAGVAFAGNRLYELGSDLDEVSDNLQIKTGLSGAALDKLRSSVEKLGTTNVPSSFADISDVAAEVTRNLHVTGPELEALTSRLANLDRMGQSVDVRSLSKAFRGFGVNAKDQVPALNSLYEASTKSGLSVDDMLSAMQKSGPALRQFGLDFGEAAALAGTFEEAGLDGEKAMAALNKAFAYFSKEGIPAEQGLRDIVSRIRELGDTPEAGELATKVFGAKGGAGFLEAIQNGTLDLDALQSSLRTTGLDINDVSADTADWSEKWQTLKNDLAVALEPAATPLFDTVNGKLDDLSTWVTENQDKVIDFFVSMGEGAISAAEVTLTALAGVVDTLHLFDTLVMKGFSWLPGYDDQAAKEFNDSLGDLSEKLNAAADSSLFEDLRNGLRDVAAEAKNAADNTDGLDVGLGRLAGKTIDLKTTINGQPANLGSWFGPATGAPGTGTPGTNPLDVFAPSGGGPGFTFGGAPGPPTSGGGKGLPSLKDLPPLHTGPHVEDTGGAIVPNNAALQQQLLSQFPGAKIDNDYRQPDGFNEHSSGEAVDIAVNPGGELGTKTPEGQAQGNAINAWLLANADALGLEYTIWQGRNWNPDGTSSPNSGSGITGGHWDHVHARVKPGAVGGAATNSFSYPPAAATGADSMPSSGGLAGSLYQDPGGQWRSNLPSWDHLIQRESSGVNQRQGITDANSGGNGAEGLFQITPQTWAAHGGTRFAPSPIQATPQEQAEIAAAIFGANPSGSDWGAGLPGRENPSQLLSELQRAPGGNSAGMPGSTALNNAYGPGYEPGIGTPGYNEYGEPGYFEVDPKDVRETQQRIDDQMEHIREADESARQAQVAIDELEVDADQAEKDAATERKRKADYDAQVARRELADLQGELGEAQKGTFSPAKESPKSSRGSSGSSGGSGLSLPSSFSGFGSAIGEFVGGQISSGLGVFGVPDSPGWLQGISKFIGGISVSDAAGNSLFDGGNMFGGGSAAPLSATSTGMGTPPPDDPGNMHGTRAGQAPGPSVVINARDTEDAFIKYQRYEREKVAAKLSRF